jgi:hypothetical protein
MYNVQEEYIRRFTVFRFFLLMYITMHGSENVKFVQFFFISSSSKLIFQTSGERIYQESAQKLFDIRLDRIPLYFSIHFSFNNLTFTHIYFVQWYRRWTIWINMNFSGLGRNVSQHPTSCRVLWIISLLPTDHKWRE